MEFFRKSRCCVLEEFFEVRFIGLKDLIRYRMKLFERKWFR